MRTASAVEAEYLDIYPYSLAVDATHDRVVTGSADMIAAHVSQVAQVLRLSDLFSNP